MKKLLVFLFILFSGSFLFSQNWNADFQFDYYTTEKTARVIGWGEDLKEVRERTVSIEDLAIGTHFIPIQVVLKDETIASITLSLRKLPPHPNEVKVDRLTGGLYVNGNPFLPFGFYTSINMGDLPLQEVYRGFNLIGPYQRIDGGDLAARKAYMDQCAALGIKVNYALNSLVGASHNSFDHTVSDEELARKQALLRNEVETFKDHPALLSWYLNDEPLGQSRPVKMVEDAYNIIKEIDPYHPVSIVFMMPNRADEFGNALDIAMTDPYPIPGPLTMVSDFAKTLTEKFHHQKALWLVPQAFGGGESWSREPSKQEVRAMTYLGLIHGMMGYEYFIRKGPNLSPKSPIVWNEIANMSLEIQSLSPWLFAGEGRKTFTLEEENLQAAIWKKGKSSLVVVVNPDNEVKKIALPWKETLDHFDVICPLENRSFSLEGNMLNDFIDALGVRVYILNEDEEKKREGVHPLNILGDPSFETSPNPGTFAAGYIGARPEPAYLGATHFLSSSVAYKGHQSLQLTLPEDSSGNIITFFPAKVEKGVTYRFSIWSKSEKGLDSVPFEVKIKELAISRTFQAHEDWEMNDFYFTVDSGLKALNISLEQLGAGRAWYDLVQVIPDPMVYQEFSSEPNASLSLNTLSDSGTLSYRLNDGKFTEYKWPIQITRSTDLEVILTEKGNEIARLKKRIPVSQATLKTIKFETPYSPKYSSVGDKTLVDGITGTLNFKDEKWLGFEGKDAAFVVDIGERQAISEVSASFLISINDGIHAPKGLEIEVSDDGENFTEWGEFSNEVGSAKRPPYRSVYSVEGKKRKTRYVKFRVINQGSIPEGFLFKGTKAWIFVDEVEVH